MCEGEQARANSEYIHSLNQCYYSSPIQLTRLCPTQVGIRGYNKQRLPVESPSFRVGNNLKAGEAMYWRRVGS